MQLTLREALIGQGHLTGQQVEAEAAEDAAERRDGDEAVGGARLVDRGTGSQDKRKSPRQFPSPTEKKVQAHSDKRRRFPGVVSSHHPAGLHRQLVHRLREQTEKRKKKKRGDEDAAVWNVHWPECAAAVY